jgi:glucokinase
MTTPATVVVAADVGGTNIKFALGECAGRDCRIVKLSVYRSCDFATFDAAVAAFLRETDVEPFARRVAGACFAVAGPVEHGTARLTNLTWRIDERELARVFAIPRVKVINDFAAAGYGVERLPADALLTLQAGTPLEGADRIVIGAGTGLGVCWLTRDERGTCVHASEGGHSDFAPVDALQDELLRHLRRKFGHVSSERVLSGAGLPRIVEFLEEITGQAPSAGLHEAMAAGDPARAVTHFALERRDALAMRALDLFVAAYGAFAGNIALIALAHGGVYIAGGIAPKIAAKLQDGTFMRAFRAKGRFDTMLASIPVYVVMNDQVGLLGALAEAARVAGSPFRQPRSKPGSDPDKAGV